MYRLKVKLRGINEKELPQITNHQEMLKSKIGEIKEIKSKKTGGYLAFNDLAPYFCSPNRNNIPS